MNEQLIDDSRLKYQEIAHINTKSSDTIFQLPFEPDLQFLTVWLTCESWSNIMPDASLMGNDARFVPANDIPVGFDGPSKGYGGGSVSMELDGETQSLDISDSTEIQLLGTTTGISIGALINPATFNQTDTGQFRYIVSKVDDANNYYGIWLEAGQGAATGAGGFTSHFTAQFANVTITGGFSAHFTAGFANLTGIGGFGAGDEIQEEQPAPSGVIHFWIWDAANNRSVRTVVNVLALDTWYWVVCTFNQSNNVALIYVNGLPAPVVADQITDGTILSGTGNYIKDMHVFSAAGDGFFQGRVADFRFYREKVLTDPEVLNLNNNMVTIANIPFGNISRIGFSLINPA